MRNHKRHRVFMRMAQADGPFGQAEVARDGVRRAMQNQLRAAAGVTPNFNILPTHLPNSASQRFGDGFFRRKARGQSGGLRGGVSPFLRGEASAQEALAMLLHGPGDASDFDEINTGAKHKDQVSWRSIHGH